jgi:hypothetical protein
MTNHRSIYPDSGLHRVLSQIPADAKFCYCPPPLLFNRRVLANPYCLPVVHHVLILKAKHGSKALSVLPLPSTNMRVELPICSFIGVVLVLIPLAWHWRARNVATLSTIAWLAITNFTHGVDSIVWANNIIIRIPVWCDISK